MASRRLHWTEHKHHWKKVLDPTQPENQRKCFVNKLDNKDKWCLSHSPNGQYWGNPKTGESTWTANEEWFYSREGTRWQKFKQDFMHVNTDDKVIATILFIIVIVIVTFMGRAAAYFDEAIKGNPYFYDRPDRRMFQEATHLSMQFLLFIIFCLPFYFLIRRIVNIYSQLYPRVERVW